MTEDHESRSRLRRLRESIFGNVTNVTVGEDREEVRATWGEEARATWDAHRAAIADQQPGNGDYVILSSSGDTHTDDAEIPTERSAYAEYIENLSPEQESHNVIRVIKGFADSLKPTPRTYRDGDGTPEFKIIEEHYAPDAVHRLVEVLFTNGELANGLWKLGFNEIIIHTTHHEEVSLSSFIDQTQLHIFGGAVPGAVRSASDHHHRVFVTRNKEITLPSSQQEGFIAVDPRPPMFSVNDSRNRRIGIGGPNYLIILFDIFGSRRNQDVLLRYLVSKWISTFGAQDLGLYTPGSLKVPDREEIIELFHKMYSNVDSGSFAAVNTRDAAKQRIDEAFRRYRSIARKYNKSLRFLAGKESLDDQAIEERAVTTLEAIKVNPLLSGFRVIDDQLRVITKPLYSELYWGGRKQLLITMPLHYRGSDDELRVKEIDFSTGIKDLPYKDDYIYHEGRFCLGSLHVRIDANMLMGEWNMAVLLVLRGLLGTDHFRKQLKSYGDEMRKAREEVEEYKER